MLRETFDLVGWFLAGGSQGTGDHGKGWRRREVSISCGQKALGVVVLELSSMHSVTTSHERSTILGLRAQQGKLACLWGNMHSRSEHW